MNNEFEKEKPEPIRNILHDFSGVAIEFWAILGAGLLAAFGVINVQAVCAIGVILAVISWNNKRRGVFAQKVAAAASYANQIGPYVMGCEAPGETVEQLAKRAAAYRENVVLSGNPWAHTVTVIEEPYSPLLTPIGQLRGGWNIYRRTISELQHQANESFYFKGCPDELKDWYRSTILPAPHKTTASEV